MATTNTPHTSRPSRRKLAPIHPGEVLRLDFLEPLGITAYRLAKDTGMSQQHIGRILLGTRGIGGDTALRLARYFGTSAQLWMNLQTAYDLDRAADELGDEIEKRVQPRKAA
ncbi:MAG: HigA family addiction module antitoxin [Phycisphaerales bacterium]